MRRLFCFLLTIVLTSSFICKAQRLQLKDFKPMLDSLDSHIESELHQTVKLSLKSVTKKATRLNFYFSESLGDVAWHKNDISWFKKQLKAFLPKKYSKLHIGHILGKNRKIEEFICEELSNSGQPKKRAYTINDHNGEEAALVRRIDSDIYTQGLSNRYIALWQSHGRYYEEKTRRWEWQRAVLFGTVEDMFTQSFVLPYLIPMLENAGAYVLTPRERDTQKYEIIADNDRSFTGERNELLRQEGEFWKIGKWEKVELGFADTKPFYSIEDKPFKQGTSLKAKTKKQADSYITWTADIRHSGKYAVYISYQSFPNSSTSAHYTVYHKGQKSEFLVNQQMGGGTWIYLGSFDFDTDSDSKVVLDNGTVNGEQYINDSYVSADAVKFGGGMGKIARNTKGEELSEQDISQLPSYMEGAMYSLIWYGLDSTITQAFSDDYTNDYASRGAWVKHLSAGSRISPQDSGKAIPIDLALAFHSDAGTFPNDSTIGTLVIYASKDKKATKFNDGTDRFIQSRALANMVQAQLVNDIRKSYEPSWAKRALSDRSYSEPKSSGVPALILELLSHQNFADMKLGLDPSFRFSVARSVYKAILKYLSNKYSFPYTVQPLPVKDFSASIVSNKHIKLQWRATIDSLEATAIPSSYILYTKKGNADYDAGIKIEANSQAGGLEEISLNIQQDKIYRFKIVAVNEGGKSFPSQELAVGIPSNYKSDRKILIVNNFDRLAPPAWFDTKTYAGFNYDLDRGVADIRELHYVGRMYEYRREKEWIDDDNAGFGSSYTDELQYNYSGNSFDYPAKHGEAIMSNGYAFCSASNTAFINNTDLQSDYWLIDLICGKQISTATGTGNKPPRFTVFTKELREALTNAISHSCKLVISGANIATDIWDKIYPINIDSLEREQNIAFAENILGYKWISNCASKTAIVKDAPNQYIEPLNKDISYYHLANEFCYNVESPDGLAPAGKYSQSFLKYKDSQISAAICSIHKRYKTVCIGFPIECIKDKEDCVRLFKNILSFMERDDNNQQ